MKDLLILLSSFIFICLCGLLCASAAGFKWGTIQAGGAAVCTFIAAVFISLFSIAFIQDDN